MIAPAEIVLRVNISRAPQPEAARPRLTFEVGDYAGTLSFAECRRIGQLLLSLTSEAPDAEGTDGFAVTLPLANRRKDRDRAVASAARFGIKISAELGEAVARQGLLQRRARRHEIQGKGTVEDVLGPAPPGTTSMAPSRFLEGWTPPKKAEAEPKRRPRKKGPSGVPDGKEGG